MAIAQIPIPLSGMDSFAKGFGLTDNLMREILARDELKQRAAQQKAALEQSRQNHLESLGIQQQAQSRLSQMLPFQIQAMRDAHVKSDPNYGINQYLALQNMIQSRGAAGVGQQLPPPSQEVGQGAGIFTPEGLKSAQQVLQPTNQSGIDLQLLKKDPMLRGFAKNYLGFDPLGQDNVLHGAARDAADLEKLRNDAGEDSPVFQNALAHYNAQLDAKKDLRDLRARTKQGLKSGEKEFFDPQTGQPLGKEIPLNAKERESEEGNILFNELYPYVYNGASPFSGEGSIRRLEQAAANYKTDPRARKIFDDYLLADKMLAATTVNEASTLKAGRTNRTYNMLKESLEAQDIPNVVKKLIKQYGVPSSAQLKAAMSYQKILSDARQKARRGTPATQRLFYNPELQAQHEEQSNSEGAFPTSVIVIDPNGNRFETTEENAIHLPKGWKRG